MTPEITENVKQLKELEKVTGISERLMGEAIARHLKRFGVNLAVSFNGKAYLLEDYYNEIVREYDEYQTTVVSVDSLLLTKSDKIPFRVGSYIYFLFDGNALVYVGQSVNLAKRIGQHLDSKEFDSVAYVEVDRDAMTVIETINIQYHNPKYNLVVSSVEELFASTLKRLFS